MKNYEIDIIEKNTYNFIIEAENEEQAKEKAYKLYEDKNEKNNYFFDSDNTIEIYENKEREE